MQEYKDEKNIKSKKAIIRNAAAVFFLVLLFLTFFSKTINNYLLPEVEVCRSWKGSLSKKLTASGEVKALQTQKVFSRGSLPILDIYVKQGDLVAEGDVLALAGTEEAQLAVKQQEFELLKLKNDLESYMEGYKPIDIQGYEKEIEDASRAVENAQEKLGLIQALYNEDVRSHINEASEKLNAAKKELEEKEEELEGLRVEAEKKNNEYERTVKEMNLAISAKSLEINILQNTLNELPYTTSYHTHQLKVLELDLQKLKNQLETYKENYKPIDLKFHEDELMLKLNAFIEADENLKNVIATYEQNSEARLRLYDAQTAFENARLALEDKKEQLNDKTNESIIEQNIYTRNINQKKAGIRLKTLEIEEIKKSIPRNGQITAPCDGLVKAVSIEKGQISNNQQVLFELVRSDSSLSIQWMLNPAKAEDLKAGDELTFKVRGENKTPVTGVVDKKEFSSRDGMYIYTSYIPVSGDSFEEGQEVEVTSTKVSEIYDLIVPASSVSEGSMDNYIFVLREREGALGKENYVEKVNILVLETDDLNTAINAYVESTDNIVVLSSKPLSDGTQVKLR